MNIFIRVLFGLLVTLAVQYSIATSENKIGLPCDPNAHWEPFHPSYQCGPSMSHCNGNTKLCDCTSSTHPQNWTRTYEEGECRLLPGSRCNSNETEWYMPEFERCVKNAKCVPNGFPDSSSMCMADASCELGDGNCVCDEGKTCLDKSIPAPPKVE